MHQTNVNMQICTYLFKDTAFILPKELLQWFVEFKTVVNRRYMNFPMMEFLVNPPWTFTFSWSIYPSIYL